MPPRMKKAINRPSKRGKGTASSSRLREEYSDSSESPPHLSIVLRADPNLMQILKDRAIALERRVLVDKIKNHDLLGIVHRTKWDGILHWGGNVYPSLVRTMYSSISRTTIEDDTCSFTLSFVDRDEEITPERIGNIIGVPCSPNGIKLVSDSPTEDERAQATRDICEFNAPWDKRKNHLTVNSLIPIYRIIHHIFTYNVYPRIGNRTELTAYMVNLLSKVVMGTPICLPSVICHTIIKFHNNIGQKNALPFGYLMTQLAFSFGISKPLGEQPISKTPLSPANVNQMNLIPNAQIPIADEPPLAQEPPLGSLSMPSPRSSSSADRLAALERDMAYMKREQKKNKKTLNKMFQYLSRISKSCSRDDVGAPPSPSPPPPDSE